MTREAELELEIARLREGLENAGLASNTDDCESKQQRELVSEMEVGQLLARGENKSTGNSKTQGNIFVDNFGGDTWQLISCMKSLVELDIEGCLVPHGIGGHARSLLICAAVRLEEAPSTPPSTTALQELIDKVERRTIDRCAEVAHSFWLDQVDDSTESAQRAIRALPTGNLKLEDLK